MNWDDAYYIANERWVNPAIVSLERRTQELAAENRAWQQTADLVSENYSPVGRAKKLYGNEPVTYQATKGWTSILDVYKRVTLTPFGFVSKSEPQGVVSEGDVLDKLKGDWTWGGDGRRGRRGEGAQPEVRVVPEENFDVDNQWMYEGGSGASVWGWLGEVKGGIAVE